MSAQPVCKLISDSAHQHCIMVGILEIYECSWLHDLRDTTSLESLQRSACAKLVRLFRGFNAVKTMSSVYSIYMNQR